MRTLLLTLSLLLLGGCVSPSETERTTPPPKTEVVEKTTAVEPEEPKVTTETVSLSAIGDVLIHDRVYQLARKGDGYDFKPAFSKVKDQLSEADITVVNQESITGGTEIGLSSYPSFNSPFEVADALKDAGIDFVTMANNHTLDRGEKAIYSAIDHWKKLDIPYTGAYRSPEDQKEIRTLTKNDVTLAFLAYTYGTNGIVAKKDHYVNYIDLPRIKKDVAAAKELSDVTVVSLHFGNEYEPVPNATQIELAEALADAGVDIIIGHHPHVLQPPAWVERADGGRTFVAYSLGNFISGQEGDERNIGGIIGIDIEKRTEGDNVSITLKNPSFLPTFTRISKGGYYEVLPLIDHSKPLFDETKQHMTSTLPDLTVREQ